tara:strand:+ start:580 stop:1116 length:537 start_codon:yes stop_codon:yes gene_type:complete
MNKINAFFLTIFLGLYFSVTAQVDVYQDDIISLLNCNGTVQEYDFEFEKTMVFLRIRVAAKYTPNSFWDKFREGKKESVEELISILAFAYRKNYRHSEIKELLNYYQTIAAQKLLVGKKEFTPEELKVIEDYKASEIAKTVATKKEVLATDVKDISYDWSKELFAKGIGALAKAGYAK